MNTGALGTTICLQNINFTKRKGAVVHGYYNLLNVRFMELLFLNIYNFFYVYLQVI